MAKNETEFNQGHIVEGLQSCHAVSVLIDSLLHGHPSIVKTDNEVKLAAAQTLINQIYNEIAMLDKPINKTPTI